MIITARIDPKEVERLNKLLIDYYGRGPSDLPFFRLIWGADSFERRKMTHTDNGVELIHPVVRQVPTYWPDLQNKYILEGLTMVPEWVETDLVDKLVYQPTWVFETKYGEPLYPSWKAIKTVLDTVRHNVENAGKRGPYKDPMVGESDEETLFLKGQEIDRIQQELFGNETDVTDALKLKSGIVVP